MTHTPLSAPSSTPPLFLLSTSLYTPLGVVSSTLSFTHSPTLETEMEFEDLPSRISIGFPLGLALLFTVIFFMCSLLCCCLHWDKLQALLRSYGIIVVNTTHMQPPLDFTSLIPQKPVLPYQMAKQKQVESLPVLMPGDEVPRFIAMACPCQPPKDERIITIKIDSTNCSQ